jgi:enoyl-CoA hydratase/carnithine racemase
MVLPFDQLLAAEGARLSLRFVKMGLVPELASSHFMVTRCGWGAASWLALSGTTVFGPGARTGVVALHGDPVRVGRRVMAGVERDDRVRG